MKGMNALNWKIAGQSAMLKTTEKKGGKGDKKGVDSSFKLDLVALKKQRDSLRDKNRVIYARKAGDEFGAQVNDGEKISQEMASNLKHYAWGSANMPPKNEWLKQGIVLHPSDNLFAYGVKCQKNGTRNFLICLEAYFLKHLLFEKKGGRPGAKSQGRRTYGAANRMGGGGGMQRNQGSVKASNLGQLLKPNEKNQNEMIVGGLSEILIRVSEGEEMIFCLPGPDNCFEASASYGIDGVTEKLRLFRSKKPDEVYSIIRRYSGMLTDEKGSGLLCFLYSIMLSRNFTRLVEDMQDQAENSLIDPMGDCCQTVLNLVILGKATPYLHNGALYTENEDTGVGSEKIGVVGRNDIGMLLWEKDQGLTDKWNLGSRLKTPALPMWVTMVNGHYGVLFNPNKELMRSYHAENRFQLYYYADAEFKKEERKDTILTIDTRSKQGMRIESNYDDDGDLDDDRKEPPLQLAVKTKWEGADIDWHGVHPYF